MEAEFKSIVLLLTTQAMMNLGEIYDPMVGGKKADKKKSILFISLLEELQKKTIGNLDHTDEIFLNEVLDNLNRIFKNKFGEGLNE